MPVPVPKNAAEARYWKGKSTEPLEYTSEESAERLLGKTHTEALRWMSGAKEECSELVQDLGEILADKPLARVVTCFSEVKLAYALQVGGAVFDAMDTDGDGELTREEVASYLEAAPELRARLFANRKQRAKRDWALLFAMLDSDGNGTVDRDEFVDFWVASGVGDLKSAHAVFDSADADGSGQLTNHELHAELRRRPDLQDRLSEARATQLQADWNRFFSLLKGDPGDKVTRDYFATLWADSGLGDAPDGLGIASQLAARSKCDGYVLVPGARADAHRTGKQRSPDSQPLSTPDQGSRLRTARLSLHGIDVDDQNADTVPLLPVAKAATQRHADTRQSRVSVVKKKAYSAAADGFLCSSLRQATDQLPPLRHPYLGHSKRSEDAIETPPTDKDIESRCSLTRDLGTVSWASMLQEQEDSIADLRRSDAVYQQMLADVNSLQSRQIDMVEAHLSRVRLAELQRKGA
eukprot:TRINITY_DN36289_c0_g1_i1.p1 TRINITY_DN36289_c0_g1~~TRINITY_DN36289_c0_g1_i1.p1  ORF type:complete len:487 (+),score=27.48 TRINITY_DN36289_c0_g1_i1:66-1463(+)